MTHRWGEVELSPTLVRKAREGFPFSDPSASYLGSWQVGNRTLEHTPSIIKHADKGCANNGEFDFFVVQWQVIVMLK